MACVHFSFLLQFIDMNADREARRIFTQCVISFEEEHLSV